MEALHASELTAKPEAHLANKRTHNESDHTILNAIRTNRSLRIVVVMATFIGWFVLSNHCALGRMAPRAGAQKAHGCCHNGTSQPVKEPAGGGRGMECCKSLHALVPDGAKLPVASSPGILALPVERPVFAVALPELRAAALATGPPPDVPAFTELVLHRSLRSHAPPFPA